MDFSLFQTIFADIFSLFRIIIDWNGKRRHYLQRNRQYLTENHRIAKEMKGTTPRIENRITESLQLNFSLSQLVCNVFSSCSPKRLSSMTSHAKIFVQYPESFSSFSITKGNIFHFKKYHFQVLLFYEKYFHWLWRSWKKLFRVLYKDFCMGNH